MAGDANKPKSLQPVDDKPQQVEEENVAAPGTKSIDRDRTSNSPQVNTFAPQVNQTNNYLLLIAIDNYTTQPVLNNPIRDAEALKKILLERYCFSEEKTKIFKNENAKKKVIKAEIKNIVERIATDNASAEKDQKAIESQLLIYFSGHGDFDSGTKEYYFALNDYDVNDDSTFLKTSDFTERFKTDNGCKNLLLIIDACYAGNAISGSKESNAKEKFSRHILMSSLADQEALDEIPRRHKNTNLLNSRKGSPFSVVLCEFLSHYSNSELLESKSLPVSIKPGFDKLFKASSHFQKIDYGDAPIVRNGSGSFLFELKERNFPPVKAFAKSLLEDLNFHIEKGEITGAACDSNTKYVVQCSVSNDVGLNKLLSRITIKELSLRIQTINYHPRIYDVFDVEQENIWGSLAKKMGWKETDMDMPKIYCINKLYGLLRYDPDSFLRKEDKVDKDAKADSKEELKEPAGSEIIAPYALGIKIANLTNETAKGIKVFCNELIEGLIKKESDNEPTSPLFLFLFDQRTGLNLLESGNFDIPKHNGSIRVKCPFILFSKEITLKSYITNGHIQTWRDRTLKTINFPTLKKIDDAWIEEKYKNCIDKIPIMDFIDCAADLNHIDKIELAKYLF